MSLFRKRSEKMKGICELCNIYRELTKHHTNPRKYGGLDYNENLKPNICEECHRKLENNLEKIRGKLGADKNYRPPESIIVGRTNFQVRTGSELLNENGECVIDTNSPIYGISIHNKITGERKIEIAISGGSLVYITGSPNNSYVVYAAVTD